MELVAGPPIALDGVEALITPEVGMLEADQRLLGADDAALMRLIHGLASHQGKERRQQSSDPQRPGLS
jgi:hypothetical protein